MVDGTGGDFIRGLVGSADLKSVYAGLATRLKQQYQLSYESQLRGVGKQVTVRLDVDGVSAEQRYTIPANCGRASATAPSAWWTRSTGALVGIALAVGLVILVSAYLALRPVPVSARRRLRRYGQSGAADKVSLPEIAAATARHRRHERQSVVGQVRGRRRSRGDRPDAGCGCSPPAWSGVRSCSEWSDSPPDTR